MVLDYESLESNYKNTFGNLTLTGQNASNKSFYEKLELLHLNGSLCLNEYFTNMHTWNVDEIIKRSHHLAEKFCMVKIFRDIPRECRYQPVAKTLADDLTGERFTNITLPNGSKRGINGAKALAKVVIDYLLKEYFDDCMEFVHTNKPSYITFDKDKGIYKDRAGSVSVCFQSKKLFYAKCRFLFYLQCLL